MFARSVWRSTRCVDAHQLRQIARRACLFALALWVYGCTEETEAVKKTHSKLDVCPPCDGDSREDATRQRAIFERWQTVMPRLKTRIKPLGLKPLDLVQLDLACVCFGTGLSGAIEGGSIRLPADWDLDEQTARAAHLGLHRQEPRWASDPALTCEQRVERAVRGEAAAHALELEVRHALGVKTHRYPFEPEYFTFPVERRVEWLYTYFVAHPKGDGVVPGFVLEYRSRCQPASARPSAS